MISVDNNCLFNDNILEFLDAPCLSDDLNSFAAEYSDYLSDGLESEESSVMMALMPNCRKRKTRDVDCLSDISSVSETTNKKRKTNNTKNLPALAPAKYANYLVSALNSNDSQKLSDCLSRICTADAKVRLNVYNVKDFQRGQKNPTNHFGNFQHAELDLDQFVWMQKCLLEVVPDGFMELASSRSCFESDTSVYISCFRMKGTIISKDATIGLGDEEGKLTQLVSPSMEVLSESAAGKFSKDFESEGSLIMYRNEEGLMERIEFYYEFTK